MSELEPPIPTVSPPVKSSRMRFSLATLLALSVAAGGVMMWLRAQFDIRELKTALAARTDENRKLRTELGALNIDDPDCVYVLNRKSLEHLHWSWRVYIPATAPYRICMLTTEIPPNGFPNNKSSMWTGIINKGEFNIDVAINRTVKDEWQVVVSLPDASISSILTNPESKWFLGSTGYSLDYGTSEQRQYSIKDTVQLLRLREMKATTPGSSTTSSEPSGGMLIWFERDDLRSSKK